jgi:beta,beta-carotene 9',10'-dioxygenase
MDRLDYTLGFEDFIEPENITITVSGQIPHWLQGNYLRNGSGKFHLGKQTVNHWFDGLSLINKFQFTAGKVTYQSALLNSLEARYSNQHDKLLCDQFGTHPEQSFFQKLTGLFSEAKFSDNTAVNIFPLGEQALCLTETPKINLLDIATLEQVTSVNYKDKLSYQISTAHPQYDFVTRKLVNLGVEIGAKSFYHLFEMDLNSYQRDLICSIPVKNLTYHHSFACTPRYIILFECPYQLNPLPFFFAMKGFGPAYIENYHWHAEKATKFIVIDRQKKCVVNEIMTTAFFMFHTANCYQQADELIIDAIIYDTPEVIQQLYLDTIQQGSSLSAAKLTRFKLQLTTNNCTQETFEQFGCEFPRYNYRYQAQTYQYLYSTGWQEQDAFINSLIKWDLRNGHKQPWQQASCYPGEPLFIANPDAKVEDEGVVLSIVLDAKRKMSFLLILDAQSWQELARVELDHVIPYGLHGNFSFKK